MKSHRMTKGFAGLIAAILCISTLAACADNPQQEVVTSKNDGAFDINALKSPTESDDSDSEIRVQHSDQFTSTDGSIAFTLNIEESISVTQMPVVEVVPHFLTGEDAKRVARELFGDAAFYERQPSASQEYSKSQLQEKIDLYSQYAGQDAMDQLHGTKDADWSEEINLLKMEIAKFTEQLESAPEENPHTPCDWTMKKERYYNNTKDETAGRDVSEDSDVIYATVKVGDIEYIFAATTRNKEDYKVNTIQVGLTSGIGPVHIDQAIYRSMLCRTEKPTEEQISAAKSRAQEMLDQMGLGAWIVERASAQATYCGDTPEYSILVNATPVINDVSALYGQFGGSLVSSDVFASNYPMSMASFEFTADGTLISFLLRSPFDMNVINDNVATVSMEELIEKAKSHLALSDAKASYGVPNGFVESYERKYDEKLICKIEISELDYGIARINVANSDDSYYYVPAIVFKGSADYYGQDTGTLYMSSGDYGERVQSLLWLNAVDGSIIGAT